MKAILMSIKPKWCELIASGKKTIEVRKTAPKAPFRAFIYCTKQRFPNKKYLYINETSVRSEYGVCDDWLKYDTDTLNINEGTPSQYETYFANGKIIGEFICEKVDMYWYDKDFLNERDDMYFITCGELEGACLTYEELCNYGKGKTLYGLHITDLKLYDKPKELSEFLSTTLIDKEWEDYKNGCESVFTPASEDFFKHAIINGFAPKEIIDKCRITRPPQSYMWAIEQCRVAVEKQREMEEV